MSKSPPLPWFRDGLRFGCTGCGKCCTGAPGYVWLSEGDIQAISTHLGLSKFEFLQKYTRYVKGKYALLEDPKNFDCVFLREKKLCTIYESRPTQCKTFPWWPDQLQNERSWEHAARYCEGINHKDAPLVPCEEIAKALQVQIESQEG